MYICLCQKISTKDIEQVVKKYDVKTISELMTKTGLATNCGTCKDEAEKLLANLVLNSEDKASLL